MRRVLWDSAEIKRYLRVLRHFQRRSWTHGGEAAIDRVLEAQTITIEKSERDGYFGARTPLRTWLSFLDDEDYLARVSSVWIDAERLNIEDRELLGRIAEERAPG